MEGWGLDLVALNTEWWLVGVEPCTSTKFNLLQMEQQQPTALNEGLNMCSNKCTPYS